MSQPSDDDLRSHFDDLRQDDRTRAPEFRALWDRAAELAPATTRSRTMAIGWIAAAAVVVLGLGIAFQRSKHRDPATPVGVSAPTISTWKSPTDGFLRASGRELLAPPPIFSSILDGATGARVDIKGD